jgi:ABC-type nitrate/sulfonate/bicarbonate transport system substrate-binding protein
LSRVTPRRFALRALSALTVASAAIALSACAPSASESSPDKAGDMPIHIGYQAATDYGLFYFAEEKGWFDEAGLDVKLSLFDDGGAQIEALAGNSVDVTLQGAQPPLLALQQGTAPIRLIGPVADSAGLFSIVAQSGNTSVEDLKGKKIAVTAGTAYDFYLDKVLEKFGMTADDVEKIDLQPLDGQGAFLSDQVDAVVPLATSRYLILDSKPNAEVVFKDGDFGAQPNPSTFSLYDLMVTTESVVKEKPEALQALVDVFYGKLMPYVTDPANRDEVIGALTDWQVNVVKAPTSKENVEAQFDGYGYYDVERAKKIAETDEFLEQVTAQAQFLVDMGKMAALPNISDMVNTTFISNIK